MWQTNLLASRHPLPTESVFSQNLVHHLTQGLLSYALEPEGWAGLGDTGLLEQGLRTGQAAINVRKVALQMGLAGALLPTGHQELQDACGPEDMPHTLWPHPPCPA